MGKHKSIQFLYVLFISRNFIKIQRPIRQSKLFGNRFVYYEMIAEIKIKHVNTKPLWTSYLLRSNPKRGNVQLIRRETPMTEFVLYQ